MPAISPDELVVRRVKVSTSTTFAVVEDTADVRVATLPTSGKLSCTFAFKYNTLPFCNNTAPC